MYGGKILSKRHYFSDCRHHPIKTEPTERPEGQIEVNLTARALHLEKVVGIAGMVGEPTRDFSTLFDQRNTGLISTASAPCRSRCKEFLGRASGAGNVGKSKSGCRLAYNN